MIRVILDTNVLVSALISGTGAPAALVGLWQDGVFELVVTPILLAEVEATLRSTRLRRWVTAEDASEFLSLLQRSGELVADPEEAPPVCRDPKDDFLFAAAITGGCQAICTGDLDLEAVSAPPVPILSPAELVVRLTNA